MGDRGRAILTPRRPGGVLGIHRIEERDSLFTRLATPHEASVRTDVT